MNSEDEQETNFSISFQQDTLHAGAQKPVLLGGEGQADASLRFWRLCFGGELITRQGVELETFNRAVNYGRLRKQNHNS